MKILFFVILIVFTAQETVLALETVEGFAMNFVSAKRIVNGDLLWMEQNVAMKTNENGEFSFLAPLGANVTLFLQAKGYHPTQTGTIQVPKGGAVGVQHSLTLQVPDVATFKALNVATGLHARKDSCHLVVTVTQACLTLLDDPQGEANTTAVLTPQLDEQPKPFYFGMFPNGDTNPLARGLTKTSLDGGVLWFNAPVGDYTVAAEKPGVIFGDPAKSLLRCTKADGRLINASPPWGPRVIPPFNGCDELSKKKKKLFFGKK